MKYNKFYIGLARNGQPNNFAIFRPQKNSLRVELKLAKSDEIAQIIETNSIDELYYDNRLGQYRIRLEKGEITKKKEIIKELLEKAEKSFNE